MDFVGVPSAQLFPVAAVAAGAIVVLYILRLRRRRVPVPYAKLWARVLADRPTTSLFAQLKRLLSLLVQLALLALFVFALADPRTTGAARRGRNLVVLIDASASMKATDVPGTRQGAAREAVRRLVREMGPADRMLLAQMDAEITALSPMTDDAGALEHALGEYQARDTGLDFARAMRFALDAVRGVSQAEVVVVGDGAHPEASDASGPVVLPADVPLRFVGVGRSGRNVGISAFSARRYPLDKSRYEVLIEVRNEGDRDEAVDLTLRADDTPLETTHFTLARGAVLQRVLGDQGGANQTLEAHLTLSGGAHDDLPADDVAYATLPARRRARVLAVSEGNLYLQAALLLDEYLEVDDVTPAEAPARLRGRPYDVVIMDGVTLPLPAGTRAIYLRPTGTDSPLALAGADEVGSTVARPAFEHIESRHPVLRWTNDLEDTNIGAALRYRLQPGDRAIASSGDTPLIVTGERRGDRFVALAFDVRRSDLPLRISWPVFLLDSIDWFAGEDPAYLSSFRTGETWRVPVPAGSDHAEVAVPGGATLTVPVLEGRAVLFGTRAGFYRVRAGGDAQLVAGNLGDPSESHCAPVARLSIGTTVASAPVAGKVGVRRELWVYLLALALGIVAIEWVTYHRRVTV